MDELEKAVVDAAVTLSQAREGSHYGPMKWQIIHAELELDRVVSELLSNHDGEWRFG